MTDDATADDRATAASTGDDKLDDGPGSGALPGRRNWLAVARKDLGDAARSWQPYVLVAVFAALAAFSSLAPVLQRPSVVRAKTHTPAAAGMESLANFFVIVLPLVILVLVQRSIVGERQRGSLRTLLAFPVSRRAVLAGTLLGRSVLVGGTLAASLAVNGVGMWLLYDSMDVGTYATFVGALVAFGLVFVGMGVGISAASRTRGRALGTAMTAFATVTILWEQLLAMAELLTGISPELNINTANTAPGWYVLLYRARPGQAWQLVVSDWFVWVLDKPQNGDRPLATFTTPGPEPFYLDTWFSAVVLLAWGVVPLLLGYVQFERADLG